MESLRIETASLTEGQAEKCAAHGCRPHARLTSAVRRAITRTRSLLLSEQCEEGYWLAELEGDTILESETILLLAFLGRERSETALRLARYLVDHQLPEGGWAMYPGGKMEISGSVKAYFALKLTGHSPSAEFMQRARRAILANGGADAVNSYTRFALAMLGQISYDECPEVPPEVALLPTWFPINLYAISSWSRTMVAPLSIVSANRPVRQLPVSLGIRELFLKEPKDWPLLRCPGLNEGKRLVSWERFFRGVDRTIKWCRRYGILPLRKRAMREMTKWLLERFERSDGVGAIYPPILWSIVALKSLGYPEDGAEITACWTELEKLMIRDEETDSIRVQPCKSPVWDTAITMRALSAGGVRSDNPAYLRGADWLLRKQVLARGDWSETVHAEPGGWCFEFNNDFYPDSDDTAMVLMALRDQFADNAKKHSDVMVPPGLRLADEDETDDAWDAPDRVDVLERSATAIQRGLQWMLAMQNDDGGWGAFDRNNDRQFLCRVPFADHNAMIDPSTPDLSARVLEALGNLGYRLGHEAVDRAVAYLRATQEPDGAWFGRWGVNYVYGTWQTLVGLVSVGVPTDDPAVKAGANWLLATQQPCGGWGESADTYADPSLRGQGTPTASQTAWAVMGLIAAGLTDHPAVARGIQFLVDRQERDGSWEEKEFTGTGFPRVFYLRYHYYPIYFPLMALARWSATAAASPAEAVEAGVAQDSTPAPVAFARPYVLRGSIAV